MVIRRLKMIAGIFEREHIDISQWRLPGQSTNISHNVIAHTLFET